MPTVKQALTATIVERRDITDDLMTMKIIPSAPFTFTPGQYCTIGLDGTWRPYSLVSAPHEPFIELFLELVPEQFRTEKSLTPKLWKKFPGDEVMMLPRIKGVFTLDQQYDTQVMISTVTGVAPFVSMVRTRATGYYGREWPQPWYILQGASYRDEFGYSEELARFEKSGLCVYVPTVSRPADAKNLEWAGSTGRVNNILDGLFGRFNINPDGKTICYLCGNEGMVKTLGNRKTRAGEPLGKLVTQGFAVKEEIFF